LQLCDYNIKEIIGPDNSWMKRWEQSTLVEHHERNLGTDTITLEKGVKVTGLGELSGGLKFTQSIVLTACGGTKPSDLYNATSVLDLLQPKGLVLECGLDMNIACCNDGDGQSNVISRTDSSASGNKSALGETPKQSTSDINGDNNRYLTSLSTLQLLTMCIYMHYC
jgi:hypothetical protein